MAIVRRFNKPQGLKDIDVLIEDDAPISIYFNIAEVPDIISQGRSSFLIGGSNSLKSDVELKLEIINDDSGAVIYTEPVPNYLEGSSRRVSIEVYDDNALFGDCTLFVVGELNPNNFDVPSEFLDTYNVRYTRKIYVSGAGVNKQPIYFYNQPRMNVSEIIKPYITTTTPTSSLEQTSGQVEGAPLTEDIGKSTNTKTKEPPGDIFKSLKKNYSSKVFGGGAKNAFINKSRRRGRKSSPEPDKFTIAVKESTFDTRMVGGKIKINNPKPPDTFVTESYHQFPAKFETEIVDVKNETVLVPKDTFTIIDTRFDEDHPEREVIVPLDVSFYTASFSPAPTQSISTVNFRSYADVRVSRLRTFSGDVYRMKLYARNRDAYGDFELVSDQQIESPEILVDPYSTDGNKRVGYFIDQFTINHYWESGSNVLASENNQYMIDAVQISGSNHLSKQYLLFQTTASAPMVFNKDVEYEVSAKIIGRKTEKQDIDGNPTQIGQLGLFLSGSAFERNHELGRRYQNANDELGFQVTAGGSNKPAFLVPEEDGLFDFGVVEETFTPIRDGSATLQFGVFGGEWFISDVSIKPATETGFSPDFIQVVSPIPTFTDERPDDYEFLAEFYDINNNVADTMAHISASTFVGGNSYIMGDNNVLSGSMVIGSAIGAGIEMAGVGSGFIRSIGYSGFETASSAVLGGKPGFLIYSGSVLSGQTDEYSNGGVGIELHGGPTSASFRFRTNPSELDIRADAFFVGSETTQFVSGSGGLIEISSSNFHLSSSGDVDMSGTITATAGNIGGWQIIDNKLSGSNATLDATGAALYKSDQGPGSDTTAAFNQLKDEYYVDFTPEGAGSSGFYIKMGPNFGVDKDGILFASGAAFEGAITASKGLIGGFTIGSSSLFSANIFISGSPSVGGTDDPKNMFISTSNFNVKEDGSITGSSALFDGDIDVTGTGTIGGFTLGTTTLTGGVLTLNSAGSIEVGSLANATTTATTNSGFFADSSGNVLIKGNSNNNDYLKISAGGSIDMKAQNFDLDAGTLVLDSGTNDGKIALGATAPTSITTNAGFYADGTGDVLIGNSVGKRISFDGTNLIMSSSKFLLGDLNTQFVSGSDNLIEISSSNFHLSSSGLLTIGAGNVVVTPAGAVSMTGTITAAAGEIGGFTIDADEIKNGSNIGMNSSTKAFTINDTTFGNTGIQLEYNSGTPRAFIGKSTGGFLKFDGSNVEMSSSKFVIGDINTAFVSGSDGSIEISSSDFHLKADGTVTASEMLLGDKAGGNFVQFTDGTLSVEGNLTVNSIKTPANIGGVASTAENASASIDSVGFASFKSASIGGWVVDPTTFATSDSKVLIDSTNKRITINDTTFGNTGIQLDFNGGTPRFFAGKSTGGFVKFDGTNVELSSSKFIIGDIGTAFISGSDSNIEISSSAFHLQNDGDFLFGNKSGGQYVEWDGSALVVRGDLAVDQLFLPATIGGATSTILNASSSLTSEGFAKFVSASIGGWDVSSNTIKGGNTTLNSNGTITLGATPNTGVGGTNVGVYMDAGGDFLLFADGDNFFKFDASDKLEIKANTFDLATATMLLDSGTNDGKVALGATPPTSITTSKGFYVDGTGKVLIGNSEGTRLTFDGTTFIVSSSKFLMGDLGTQFVSGSDGLIEISSSNFHLSSSGLLTIGAGNVVVTPEGAVTMTGTVTAAAGEIGGFTIDSDEIKSGTNIGLNSNTKAFSINDTTFGNTGIQLEYNSGTPRAFIGKNTGGFIKFDGSNVEVSSSKFILGDINTAFISGSDSNIEISSSKFHIKNDGSVIMEGTITATGGTIGGFTIDADEIKSTNLLLDSANEKITVGSANAVTIQGGGTDNFITMGKTTFGQGTTVGAILGMDATVPTLELFKDANNKFIFNNGGIEIKADTFDLATTTMLLDSGTNDGKIALGATPPTSITTNKGFYADGTGGVLIGDSEGTRLTFDGTTFVVSSSKFLMGDLSTQFVSGSDGNIEISSSNFHLSSSGLLTIGAGNVVVQPDGSLTMVGTVTAAAGEIGGFTIDADEIKAGSTLILDSDTESGQIKLGSATSDTAGAGIYMDGTGKFRFGTATSGAEYVHFDGSNIDIKTTNFKLDTANLDIDSANKRIEVSDGSAVRVRIGEVLSTGTGYGIVVFDGTGTALSDEIVHLGDTKNQIASWSLSPNQISSENLVIDSAGIIQTADFASGVKGWRITSANNGEAEFEKVTVRGTLSTTVFEKESVNAVGGQLYVANSTIISSSTDVAVSDTTMSVANVGGFVAGEVLSAKKITDTGFSTEYLLVESASRDEPSSDKNFMGKLYVVRGYSGSANETASGSVGDSAGTAQSYTQGQVLVSTGKTDTGFIRLNANPNDTATPYIDIVERTGSAVFDIDLKARLGDLSGLSAAQVGSSPGFGLFTERAFLTKDVTVGTLATEHIVIDATSLLFKDGATVMAELRGTTWTIGGAHGATDDVIVLSPGGGVAIQDSSNDKIVVDSDGVTLTENNQVRAIFGATSVIGSAGAAVTSTSTDDCIRIANGTVSIFQDNNNKAVVNASGMTITQGGTDVAKFGAITTIGDTANEHISASSAGVHVHDGGTVLGFFTAGGLTLGSNAAGQISMSTADVNIGDTSNEHVKINSVGMTIFDDAVPRAAFHNTGSTIYGPKEDTFARINNSGISIVSQSVEYASFGATTVVGTSTDKVTLTSGGITIRENNVDTITMASGVVTVGSSTDKITINGTSGITIKENNADTISMINGVVTVGSSTDKVTINGTSGITIRENNVDTIKLINGAVTFNAGGTDDQAVIDSDGMKISSNGVVRAAFQDTGSTFYGDDPLTFARINSSGMTIVSASNTAATFGEDIVLTGGTITVQSDSAGGGNDERVVVGSGNIAMFANDAKLIDIEDGSINIGPSADAGQAVIGNVRLGSGGAFIYGAATNDYVNVKSDGVDVVAAGTTQAAFGATTTIGDTSNEHVSIASTGVSVKDGSTVVGSFNGKGAIIGDTSGPHISSSTLDVSIISDSDNFAKLDSDSLDITVGGNQVATFGANPIITGGTVTVRNHTNNNDKVVISENKMEIFDNNNAVATFAANTVIEGGTVTIQNVTNNNDKVVLSENKLEIFDNNNVVAEFGANTIIEGGTITIRNTTNNNDKVILSENKLEVFDNNTRVAKFGAITTIGDTANEHISASSAGITIKDGTTTRATFSSDVTMQGGTITLNGTAGTVGHDRVVIGSADIGIFTNNEKKVHINDSGMNIGPAANAGNAVIGNVRLGSSGVYVYGAATDDYVFVKSDGVEVVTAGTNVAEFGAITRIGDASNEHISMSSAGVTIKDGSTVVGSFKATGAIIGDTAGSHISASTLDVNVKFDDNNFSRMDSNSLDIVVGGNTISTFGATSTIGNTSAEHVLLNSVGLTIKDGSTVRASLHNTGSTIYANDERTFARLNSSGLTIVDSDVVQGTFHGGVVSLFGGSANDKVVIDEDGIEISTNNVIKAVMHDTGSTFYGDNLTTFTRVNSSGMEIVDNNITQGTFSGGTITLFGGSDNDKLVINSDGLKISSNGVVRAALQDTGSTFYGDNETTFTQVNSSGLTIVDNNVTQGTFSGGTISLFGGSDNDKIVINSDGIKLSSNGVVRASFQDTGSTFFGDNDQTFARVNSSGLTIVEDNATVGSFTSKGVVIGDTAGSHISSSTFDVAILKDADNFSRVNASSFEVVVGGAQKASFGANTLITGGELKFNDGTRDRLIIDSSDITLVDESGNQAFNLDTNVLTLGEVASNQENIVVDPTNGIQLRTDTTTHAQLTAAQLVMGEVGNSKSRVEISSGAVEIINRNGSGTDSTVVALDAAGNATFNGAITSSAGSIGGFTIDTAQLHTGTKTTFASLADGVYIGTDGIRITDNSGGGDITIDPDGTVAGEPEMRFSRGVGGFGGSSAVSPVVTINTSGSIVDPNTAYSTGTNRVAKNFDDGASNGNLDGYYGGNVDVTMGVFPNNQATAFIGLNGYYNSTPAADRTLATGNDATVFWGKFSNLHFYITDGSASNLKFSFQIWGCDHQNDIDDFELVHDGGIITVSGTTSQDSSVNLATIGKLGFIIQKKFFYVKIVNVAGLANSTSGKTFRWGKTHDGVSAANAHPSITGFRYNSETHLTAVGFQTYASKYSQVQFGAQNKIVGNFLVERDPNNQNGTIKSEGGIAVGLHSNTANAFVPLAWAHNNNAPSQVAIMSSGSIDVKVEEGGVWGLRVNGGWSPSDGLYNLQVTQDAATNLKSTIRTAYMQLGSGGIGGIYDQSENLVFQSKGDGESTDLMVKIGNMGDTTAIQQGNTGDGNNTYVLIDDGSEAIHLSKKLVVTGSYQGTEASIDATGSAIFGDNDAVHLTTGVITLDTTAVGDTTVMGRIYTETSQAERLVHISFVNINGGGTTQINTATSIGGTMTVTGDVKPATSATYDLGSTSLRWNNVYTTDLQLSNMDKDTGNEVDGTKGDWTIQEGEDDLFIINRKNGKKYKFKLEEVT